MDFKKLGEPFSARDIEWRLQQCGEKSGGGFWGKCLAYVTNRAIQQRLDDVIGAENWKNEFAKAPDGGVMCGISIRIVRENGEAEWVTKWDGAENTDIEAVKGGLSGAMKRAAVQWNIGRYLYNLEEGWVEVNDKGLFQGKTKSGKVFRWNPPELPDWALPRSEQRTVSPQQATQGAFSRQKQSAINVDEMIDEVRKYIADGTLQDLAKAKALAHIKSKDVNALKAVLEYCSNNAAMKTV